MATVLQHLRQIAEALAAGRDADVGCPALVECWISAGTEEFMGEGAFQTGVELDNDDLVFQGEDQGPFKQTDDWRFSYGSGVRLGFSEAMVVRIDVGFSDEETGLVYLTFGHPF